VARRATCWSSTADRAVGERLEAPEGAAVVDGRGHLAVPGLVDAHAHLDKTLWGLP
jgi:cytosine/adenosine deaminase-related metal-dependent hydrolase